MRNYWLTWVAVCPILFGLSLGGPAAAQAAGDVGVTIEIIKASKTSKGFTGAAQRYRSQIARLGFSGAKVIDKVTARQKSVGESVELSFREGARGSTQRITVKVLSSTPKSTKLHIAIPAYRFRTETTHKKNGALVVFVSKADLFLAVRPNRR